MLTLDDPLVPADRKAWAQRWADAVRGIYAAMRREGVIVDKWRIGVGGVA